MQRVIPKVYSLVAYLVSSHEHIYIGRTTARTNGARAVWLHLPLTSSVADSSLLLSSSTIVFDIAMLTGSTTASFAGQIIPDLIPSPAILDSMRPLQRRL